MTKLSGKKSGNVIEHYWVADGQRVWSPCIMKGIIDDMTSFDSEDGRVLRVRTSQTTDLERVLPHQLDGVDDVCSLQSVSEGALLYTIRKRYLQQVIYTNVSRVLIAVNPFTTLPIYSSTYLDRYIKGDENDGLPPHIFGLSENALQGLRRGIVHDHVILISGESGAGKTESAKLILAYVAEATRGEKAGIEEKILQTSPIFESFGNAMTLRNNNSSRFGKWLDIRFNSSLQIRDCALINYLLETTRVCGNRKGDRSYHIFYQLIQARSDFSNLGLHDLSKYSYLKGGESKAPGIDDAQAFEETLDAFASLCFDVETQAEIFRIVAAVLTLGNCEMVTKPSSDESQLVDEAPAKHAAELLGVELEELKACMLQRRMKVEGKEIQAFLREDQARNVRDTLAQLIYGRLFEWLVQHMNIALQAEGDPPSDADRRTLGVLDIAGFESFQKNSLEQLLINLSNEHLQQSFNTTIVKSELEDYAKEGVSLKCGIAFKDNADCLELIDGKGGILEMLDEEGNLPKATDSSYQSKLLKAFGKHTRFVVPKVGGTANFGVRHFAGEVTYTCDGFLEKNRQKLPEVATTMFSQSSLGILREFGKTLQLEAEGAADNQTRGVRTMKKQKSSSAEFRISLRKMVQKIEEAERHYIRCVKPNHEKKAGKFEAPMVMEQLLFSGILEAVHIRQQGFSVRMPFDDFVQQYRCIVELLGKKGGSKGMDVKDLVEALPNVLGNSFDAGSLVLGKTKVMAKSSAVAELDDGRKRALSRLATIVQAKQRAICARKRCKRLRELNANICNWLQQVGAFDVGTKTAKVHTGSITKHCGREKSRSLLQDIRSLLEVATEISLQNQFVHVAGISFRKMDQELDALSDLVSLSSSTDSVAIEKALARCRGLCLDEPSEIVDRCKKLQLQLPLVQAMNEALASEASEERNDRLQELVKKIGSLGLQSKPGEWVGELQGADLFSEVLRQHQIAEEAQRHAEAEAQRKRAEQQQAAEEEELKKRKAEEGPAIDGKRVQEDEAAVAAAALAEEHAVQGRNMRRRSSKKQTLRKNMAAKSVHSDKILEGLREAASEFDAERLEDLLRSATLQDLDKNDVLPARLVFQQLQSEAFVLEALKDAEAEADQPEPNLKALKRLQNLAAQVKRLRGDEEKTRGARRSVAVAVHRAAIGDAIQDPLSLGSSVFKSLSDFPGLKPLEVWRGHRPTVVAGAAKRKTLKADGTMLCHSKITIAEALTRVPADFEDRAVQNFRDIMIWMADRPAQDCQRQAARDAILNLIRTSNKMRDEIYVQVLKQLTDNPGARSERFGWQLLNLLCTSVAPSDEICEFVKAFIKHASTSGGDDLGAEKRTIDVSRLASECLASLEASGTLTRLSGFLWKKSPKSLRFGSYDWRYFTVRNMQILWWKTAEDAMAAESASPDGGPLCKGFINLLANESVVTTERGDTLFSVKAVGITWAKNALLKTKRANRIFTFDTSGSEHSREKWMEVIAAQLKRASDVRQQYQKRKPGQSFDGQEPTFALSEGEQSPSTDMREHSYSITVKSAVEMEEWENAPDLVDPKTGDEVFYKCQCNKLPDGSELVYGARGEVLQVRPAENDAPIRATIKFPGVQYNISCALREVSHHPPPQVLAGGWRLNDVVWYVGELNELDDGSQVRYGSEGEIVGPSTLGDKKDSQGVAVRFAGISNSVSCFLSELSRHQPSSTLAGGWKVGDVTWYKGQYNAFDDGARLVYGQQGEIIGPDIHDKNRLTVKFSGIELYVACFLVDLARDAPETYQAVGGNWHLGDKAYYKGGRVALPDGGEVFHGLQGEIAGRSMAGDGEDHRRVAVRFPGVKQLLNIWLTDLSISPP